MSEYKLQYSQMFGEGEQFVVRADETEEFKTLVSFAKTYFGQPGSWKPYQASEPLKTQNFASNRTSEGNTFRKVPYLRIGSECPICTVGSMVKTVKENKQGEKYDCLICDQDGCKGYAYISKY